MTKREKFVLWLNKFNHTQNKITICFLYSFIMIVLAFAIYGATHQQTSSNITVRYTRPTLTLNFSPNGGEFDATGGGGYPLSKYR